MLTQNLVVNKEFAFPKTTGFNRTFMELKVNTKWQVNDSIKFQSHLYGIERISKKELLNVCFGFNRTFMELKEPYSLSPCAIQPFQSHLYGIESEKGLVCYDFIANVSIAPLWN